MTTTLASETVKSSPALLLEDTFASPNDNSINQVIVHPLVLLHVLDHHTRRQELSGRVIGTLLGRIDGHTVEVTNCYAIPHAERGEDIAIGKDYNKTMLALHMRCSRKEVVVGWYASLATTAIDENGGSVPSTQESSNNNNNNNNNNTSTSSLISTTTSLIHDFYAAESDETEPIHLVVDTRLQTDALAIRAYKSVALQVQGEPLGNLFHELPIALRSNDPETICLYEMTRQDPLLLRSPPPPSAPEATPNGGPRDSTLAAGTSQYNNNDDDYMDGLQVSMEKLYSLLEQTLRYVDSVVEGRVEADPDLGRTMADTLATVPRVRPEVFDRLFHDSLQDLLMVTYLSNITRTQITLAEKLNATLGVQ